MSMNDTPTIGHNAPEAVDYAKIETERLEQEYSAIRETVDGLLADYEKIPARLVTPEDKAAVVSLIKRMRDTANRLDAYHKSEKQPHFRRGQAVDQYFFALVDLIAKRDKKSNDGAADTLGKRLTEYDTAELARESARRRQASLDARKEADQAQAELEEAEKVAAAARAAAEAAAAAALRAKKPENIAARTEEARVAVQEANIATTAANELQGAAAATSQRADQAYIDTLARPADVMRTRGSDGSLSTMGTEKFAIITDIKVLDLEALRPHLRLEALQVALNGYATQNGHSNDALVQIKGASFGKRPKSKVL